MDGSRRSGNWVAFVGAVILGLMVLNGVLGGRDERGSGLEGVSSAETSAVESENIRSHVGFTSVKSLEAHFEKHGKEFGEIDRDEYLLRAQRLRDEKLSSSILEGKRESDGVMTRFRLKGGEFVAFHEDLTIRTFFKPNDGEDYFWRQLKR